MQPRLILRTHYQVDEPAYMEFLIQACTSAIHGADAATVAARLTEEVERRCRRGFNVAAAAYGIHLAKALGLLTPYHTWTDRGHLVNLVAEVGRGEPERQLSLSPAEKVLHLRLFLEADGAALIAIARHMVKHGSISQAEVVRSTFVEDTFIEIWSAYLPMTSSPDERAALQERIDELRAKGYAGRTGQGRTRQHKLRIHVQTLYRLGLLWRVDRPRGLTYRLPPKASESVGGVVALLREVPDIAALEERLAAGEWLRIASRVLGIVNDAPADHSSARRGYLLALLARFYAEVMSQSLPRCPLQPVVEAIQIRALAERGWLLSAEQVAGVIVREEARVPQDVRLLADRGRKRSAIRLSDSWIRTATGW